MYLFYTDTPRLARISGYAILRLTQFFLKNRKLALFEDSCRNFPCRYSRWQMADGAGILQGEEWQGCGRSASIVFSWDILVQVNGYSSLTVWIVLDLLERDAVSIGVCVCEFVCLWYVCMCVCV
jgi:hypothetical protein